MAEFDDSLLRFDSVLLDVNENPPITENHLFTDIGEIKTVPPNTEILSKCDLTFSESLQSYENSNNFLDISENVNEIHGNKSDVIFQNVDERNTQCSSTLSETLDTLTTPNICTTQMPEITNEIHTNELDLLPPDVGGNYAIDRNSDSGIHDSENNIVEDMNMLDFAGVDLNFSDNCGVMISEFNNEENDVQVKDEEFHDAVQFFKDPSSFTFLENAGSANAPTDPLMTRSSLYVNFDPLHAKFYPQSVKPIGLQGIAEDDVEPEEPADNIQSDIVNKHLANVSPRESLGNILISFDSPVTSKDTYSLSIEDTKQSEPQKLYTEEELQQALKIQELSVQEIFLKKQQDLELKRSQKQQEMENKMQEQNHLCHALHCLIKEIVGVAVVLSEKEKVLHEKLEMAEKENDKLKEDVKTSVEDLQSVESTFSDFHKRYEQCKSMLKVYTQNEDNLKQQLENMKVQLQEKEEMYKVLQSRTQEMLDKANTEVANVKRSGDAQVAVLKAQLKKAELKISSLESDVKHVKIENGKLSSICDELMVKVSEA